MSAVTWRAVWGCDTETDWTADNTSTWIVQWSLTDGTTCRHGRTLEELMHGLEMLMRSSTYKKTVVYFHNLKFDVAFLLPAILDWERSGAVTVRSIVRRGRPVMVQIMPAQKQWKGTLELRDSLLKLPQTRVKDLGRLVGLDKLVPPSDDGGFYAGWSDTIVWDSHAYDYVDHDAMIVALAMRKLHKDGWTASTVTGDAWRNAHHLIAIERGKYAWEHIYPELPLEMDRWMRRAYPGGVNYSAHIGLSRGPITHIDIHSSYPSIMAGVPIGDMPVPMPVGKPDRYVTGIPKQGLWIGEMECKLKLKKGMRPWLFYPTALDALAEGADFGDSVTETKLSHVWVWTSVDFENIQRFYDISDLDFHGAWTFHGEVGTLEPYIREWYGKKEAAKREHGKDSLEYVHAKRMINALYGRFGLDTMTPDVVIDDDGGIVKWKEVQKEWPADAMKVTAGDCYVAYAAFAAAYARYRLLDPLAWHGRTPPLIDFADVIHMDTDSIIYRGEPVDGMIGDDLGQWGIESRPDAVIEGGPKRYVELKGDPDEIGMSAIVGMACAGVPDKMRIELLDDLGLTAKECTLGHAHYQVKHDWLRKWCRSQGMNPDDIDTRKLLPEHVKGGVILTPHTHHLDKMAGMVIRWVRTGEACR